jgi:hypothetical protein
MSSHPHSHGELVNENVQHESSDINVRAIITFMVALFAITIAIQAAMVGLFWLFNKVEDKTQPQVSAFTPGPAQVADFPSPSLQTTPWTDLQKLRASETEYLNGYGWVDQNAGIARIPIDRAKALLLQKGIPVRAGAAIDPTEGTHYASTGESNGGRWLKAGGADESGAPAAPSQGMAPVPATPGADQAAGANAGPQTQPNPSVGQAASATAAKAPGAAAPKSPKATKAGGGGL